MTQENIIPENAAFDFGQFQKDAIKKIKSGQPLMGDGGVISLAGI